MDVTSSKSTQSGVVMEISWDILSGWWLSHPSEKYESQLGLLFPIYGKS